MFNSTNEVVFLKHNDELYNAIIECISTARNLVAQAYKKTILTADEGGSRNYPSATIFRFFEEFDSAPNKKIFDEKWVNKVLSLAIDGVQGYESVFEICTEKGRSRSLNNNLSGYCKADAILLLHLLWVAKAILLPIQTPMPNRNGRIGQELYRHKELLPELLSIFTNQDRMYPLENIVGSQGMKNTLWYAYRVIRASTWYSVTDINQDEFEAIFDYAHKHPGYSFTLRQWLVGLSIVHPEVPYSSEKIPIGRTGTQAIQLDETGTVNLNADHGFDKEVNSKINQWIDYIQRFGIAKKNQGAKSWKDSIKYTSYIVSWLINEIAKINPALVPAIPEFKRKHLDGFDGLKGLLDYLRGDNKPSTYKNSLYKIDKFFDYLESFDEFSFRNKINKDIDYPFVSRSSGTSKVIFDSDVFAPLLSFAYALADWGWYLYEKSLDGNLADNYHNNLKHVETESLGFVPLFWVNGRPHPIKYISPKLAPIAARKLQDRSRLSNIPDIHHINLLVVLFETGIRLQSARWLDARNYRKSVNNKNYRERDYGVTKLFVNTDKVGHTWESSVSNTVIEILDRHATYRANFEEECLQKEYWYDGHENSPFGKVKPLFSTGGHGFRSGTPISDTSVRKAHKLFIYLFQAYYYDATGIQIENLNYDPNDNDRYNVFSNSGFENILQAYSPSLIQVTPHSARSQVVSQYITLLPPSEIMKITGHTTEAHCVYYAQLDRMVLDRAKEKQFEEIFRDFSSPAFVSAQDKNSALRESFRKNRDAMLSDFGATSFATNHHHSDLESIDAVELIRTKNADDIAFNTTHLCPFNNICPDTVIKQFGTDGNSKPCGGCFYSVKTIDHIPAILAKIRAFTDESDEIQQYLKKAKKKGVDPSTLTATAKRRRFLSDEIIAWTIAFQCLEQMATELNERDNWLVQKPELLSQELTRMEIKNDEFQSLFVKASEAKSYAEFFTPTLEHQIIKARTKLLAHTGNFKALMDDTPDGYELIDQYRGLVKTICSTLGIDISDLASRLEKPLSLPEPLRSPLALLTNTGNEADG